MEKQLFSLAISCGFMLLGIFFFRKAAQMVDSVSKGLDCLLKSPTFSKAEEVRIRLDDEDFKALVAGKEILKQDVEGTRVRMILADIGWDRMEMHIFEASKEAST